MNLPFMEEGRIDATFMVAYIPQGKRDEASLQAATAYAIERLNQVFIHGLREVTEGTGTVVGGYFDRADMDALKEKIKEIEILMADEWRLR